MSRRNRSTAIQHLRQQTAVELQQATAVDVVPSGKNTTGSSASNAPLHSLSRLHRRAAMSARNVNRPRHRRHPSDNRPASRSPPSTRTRKDASPQTPQYPDSSDGSKSPLRAPEIPPRSRSQFPTPAMPARRNDAANPPVASRVAGRFTSSSVPRHRRLSHQPKSSRQRPKEIHQIGPRLSTRLTTSIRSLSCCLVLLTIQRIVQSPAKALHAVHHNWIYRRIALPILALLRMGASPERLAWSIAAGLAHRHQSHPWQHHHPLPRGRLCLAAQRCRLTARQPHRLPSRNPPRHSVHPPRQPNSSILRRMPLSADELFSFARETSLELLTPPLALGVARLPPVGRIRSRSRSRCSRSP